MSQTIHLFYHKE